MATLDLLAPFGEMNPILLFARHESVHNAIAEC
jgi:hypothetical protein